MITGKILKYHGWEQGRAIGLAKAAAAALADADAGLDRDAILARLDAVRKDPAAYLDDPILGPLATELDRRAREASERAEVPQLHAEPIPYRTWGEEDIEPAARAQMEAAMRLPVSVAGALMPDAHVGYGLPIGGVLATQEAVIPYAVGVDIACFAGHTKVSLLNGEERTLKELAEEVGEIGVYVCTPSGRVKAAQARAWKTHDKAPLVEVALDNGERIECTPDHRFMLRDGTYRMAEDLEPGVPLMPLYRSKDRHGYTLVQQNYSGRWQKAHWVVARSGLCGPVPLIAGQRTIIHHRDFCETNNDPSNLEFMGNKDHSVYHRSIVERNTAWHSEEFERRRLTALAAMAKTVEGHAYLAERGLRNIRHALATKREAMIANWATAGERGREHLIRKNQSEAGRAKSREMANRYYPCEKCGEMVKSYIGLHNHRRLIHGYNHQVVSVRRLDKEGPVYCLSVPQYENFALSAGVFVHNCRMRLSIYPENPDVLDQNPQRFTQALLQKTHFGAGKKNPDRPHHAVLDDPAWKETKLLRSLHPLAAQQLGTSGSGNHFVEWGAIELEEPDPRLGLEPGRYLALLSHSGSRGVGFKIANAYSQIAMDKHRSLDRSVRHLAWLPLVGESGQEYWLSMELAGRFASANHFVIHHAVAKAAGLEEMAVVENHHNFCVPGSAYIPTTRGPKRMEDIVPGDHVYALGDEGLVPTKVVRHWLTATKPIVAIRTRHRSLRCSPDHPVLAVRRSNEADFPGRVKYHARLEWRRADSLVEGDMVVCGEGYRGVDEDDITPDKARLLGAFTGDGWRRHDTARRGHSVGVAIGAPGEPHTQKYLALVVRELPQYTGRLDLPAGVFVERITSIERQEAEPVYDIEVEHPSHSFVCEGVVVHNCWKEEVDGRDLLVHRKGATPAGSGVLGVIPGSMADPGFVVRGRGVPDSLDSAAHGAGRAMGRKAAIQSIAKEERDRYLKARGVTLLGGGIDEAPQAYKRIDQVIAAQKDLVDILGTFRPRIVRMATESRDI